MIDKNEFLRLAVIEQKKYDEIEKILKTDRKTLTDLWEKHKEEREYLSSLRQIWRKKFEKIDFYKFKKWYEETPHRCHYCEITEEKIEKLVNLGGKLTKRNRGTKLVIDRKEPELEYDKIDNLVFSCYWCNNAKTDTFTASEFKEIGKAIKKVWQKRLSK